MVVVCWITNQGNVKRKEMNFKDALEFLPTREMISFTPSGEPIVHETTKQFIRFNDILMPNQKVTTWKKHFESFAVLVAPFNTVWLE